MPDIVSASFGIMMVGMYYRRNLPSRVFRFISRISYALYLVHLPIFLAVSYGLSYVRSNFILILGFGVAWLMAGCLAYLLYRYYEQPLLRQRPAGIFEK
jgi:peptidoglycan/LPS O-acetylase OafA/YrhL